MKVDICYDGTWDKPICSRGRDFDFPGASTAVWFSLTKTKNEIKRKRKMQNENDNNADNSSLKAALRRLTDCAPETHRDWIFQLCCWNVLWYSSELQCYRVLAGSRGWISTSVQDRHWSDFSPSVTGVCWTPVQRMWRPDGGQAEQNVKKTFNVAYFSEWTWSTFDNVNPVNGRECLILTADLIVTDTMILSVWWW